MRHTGDPRYLLVEAGAKVLVLEDSAERCERFLLWLPDCVICRTVTEAIEAFSSEPFDWIFVDRDLGPGDGYGEDFTKHIAEKGFKGRTIIHSANVVVAEHMEKMLRGTGINVERIPFTILGVFQEQENRPTKP